MRTVRRYIADGQLETVRLGRKTLRIRVDSIEQFVDARPVGNWRQDRRWSPRTVPPALLDPAAVFLP